MDRRIIDEYYKKIEKADYRYDSSYLIRWDHLLQLLALASQEQPKAVEVSDVVLKPLDIEALFAQINEEVAEWQPDGYYKIESILKDYGTSSVKCYRCWDGYAEDDVCWTCLKAMWLITKRDAILDEAIEDINLFVGELYAGSKLAETLLPWINAIRPVIEKLKSKTIETGQK